MGASQAKVDGGSVLRRALGAADAAAVPLEQHAEGVDENLVRAEIVTFCLEGAVQAAESFYHLDIIDHVLHEIGRGLDAQRRGEVHAVHAVDLRGRADLRSEQERSGDAGDRCQAKERDLLPHQRQKIPAESRSRLVTQPLQRPKVQEQQHKRPGYKHRLAHQPQRKQRQRCRPVPRITPGRLPHFYNEPKRDRTGNKADTFGAATPIPKAIRPAT